DPELVCHVPSLREYAVDLLLIGPEQGLALHELAHRAIAVGEAGFAKVVTQVLDKDRLEGKCVRQPHDFRQLVQVLPHQHHDQSHVREIALQPRFRGTQAPDVIEEPVKLGAHANALVSVSRRAIDGGVQPVESAAHAFLGPPWGEERAVRIGADSDTSSRCEANHVEKPRVHHRLSEPLEMKLLETRKLVEERFKDSPFHERRWPIWRPVLTKLDWAHGAAQIA